MAMNGTSQDATTYVNGITTVAIYLLANTDEKVINNLLSQVGEGEKIFIKTSLAGIQQHLNEK